MLALERVAELEFPPPPPEVNAEEEIRGAYVRGSAYVTLALEEAEYPHSRSEEAAAVSDMTHQLREEDDPAAYLELAQQEVEFVVAEAEAEWFEREMEFVRQTIDSAY